MFKKGSWILAFCICCIGLCLPAHGATVFETTELIGATAAANARVPQPVTFEIATAGNYVITLTDLRTPVSFSSLRAIVTSDLNIVSQLQVTYPASPPQPATQTFMATAGKHRIHVLGIPAAGAAGGGFGISVAPAAGGTALVEHADAVAAPSTPGDGQSALQDIFNIAQAGTYRLVLTDLTFPVALVSTQTLLLQETSAGPVVVPINQGSFDAVPGVYQLLIVATAAAPSLSGLYSVSIDSGPGSAVVYQTTQPVGNLQPATDVAIATAGQHTLTLTDAAFPAPLASLAAIVTQNGGVLGNRSAVGSVNFIAAQGTVTIYARATPTAVEGVGAFGIQLTRDSQNVYAETRIADTSPDPTTPAIYSVESTNAVAAGNYRLQLEDFAFPLSLASLKGAVTQGATVVGTPLTAAGNAQFTVQSAVVKILIAVQPPASGSRNALFGMTFTPSAGGAAVLETTQGVGSFFRTHTVSVPATGPYDLTLSDLAFPSVMPTAALAITRGTTLVGQIFGGGTVPRQQLTAGTTYVLNFLGEPATSTSYGTYGLKVSNSPPQPTVSLSASPTSITSGQQTTLQWSSNDATTCTASGGWAGTKSTSGTQTVGPLNANTTFELSCTGAGGSGNASVSVAVTAPSSNGGGGGGGGGMSLALLVGLCLLFVARFGSRLA